MLSYPCPGSRPPPPGSLPEPLALLTHPGNSSHLLPGGEASPVILCQVSSPSRATPFKAGQGLPPLVHWALATGQERTRFQAGSLLEALADPGTPGEVGADLHSVRRWLTGPQLNKCHCQTQARVLELWVLFGEGSVLSLLPSSDHALSNTPRPPGSPVVSPGQVRAL